MAFNEDPAFELGRSRFSGLATRFEELAVEVGSLEAEFNVTGHICDCCGTRRLNNFPQHQVHARVAGVAERLREIADTLRRRSSDRVFLGLDPMPVKGGGDVGG